MIKKSTLYLIALSCLAVGFVAGVIFSAIQNTPAQVASQPSVNSPAPSLPVNQPGPEVSQAIVALRQQVEENPNDYQAWVHLGNTYYDSGQPHEAITAYEKALVIRDDSANVWTDLGVMYRRHGEPKKAVSCFEEASRCDPQHASALYNKGLVLLADLNDRPGAIAAWKQLVTINPQAATPNGKLISDLLAELQQQDTP